MDSNLIASLASLSLLGIAVAGWFITHNRESLGKVAQQAAVWGFIFLGVIAAVGMWGDISREISPRQGVLSNGQIEVPVGRDGHFHLTLDVNGTPINFVVDTGASQIVLSQEDAAKVGIETETLAYLGSAQTANGTVRTATVWLDSVAFEGVTDTGVRAVVNQGELFGSLLGMSYLSQFSRIEIADGKLLLTP